jgi:adenylate cyclase
MKLSVFFARVVVGGWRHFAEWMARRLRNNFYLYLAATLSLLVVADAFTLRSVVDMRQTTYDLMMRYRVVKPAADDRIVIVDINEASLAAMAPDYGRWPWPRQVLAEFVQHLEEQRPKAVVFDILFSDPDVYNADSDAYFNDAIAQTDNTYFPWLRLAAENDKLSDLKPAMIPGATAVKGMPETHGTIAAVLPFFKAVRESGRIGTHNIYPDSDGVVRSYRLFGYVDGWRLPSLPQRIGADFGFVQPPYADILLNWRGRPFTYRYVSFSDVFQDMQRKDRARSQNEFSGKIVIIGSTAPSLFDIKPTSMAREFPGVEILATAIDNLKHDDYIRTPASSVPNLIMALLIVWATAIALYRDPDSDRFNRVFGLAQFGLLGFSYAMINVTHFHLNLTGPVFVGFIYFSVAKIYSTATARALEKSAVATTMRAGHANGATLAVFQFDGGDDPVSALFLRRLRKQMLRLAREPMDLEIVKGRQRGLWGLFEATVTASWAYSLDDAQRRQGVEQDLQRLREAMPGLIESLRVNDEKLTGEAVRSASVGAAGTEAARAEWRVLFATALEAASKGRH